MAELVWLRPVVGCIFWKGKITQLRSAKIHLYLDMLSNSCFFTELFLINQNILQLKVKLCLNYSQT